MVAGSVSRLPAFVGVEDPTDRLRAARIAIVGVGSIGLATALHLARSGIGGLLLIDRDRLGASSVLTHPIDPPAIGQPKTAHAAARIAAIAPDTLVETFQGDFVDAPADLLLDSSCAILAVDNLETEVAVGARCVQLGTPLVQASVHGATLVATLRVFAGADGPCPACLFTAAEWEQVSAESQYACDGSGQRELALRPTRATSSLCSLAAELAVHRVLSAVLGVDALRTSEICEYRGFLQEIVRSPLRRHPDCPVDHSRWQVRTRTAERTVGEALPALRGAHAVSVPGRVFVPRGRCGAGHASRVARFLTRHDDLGACPTCGARRHATPFDAAPHATSRDRNAALPDDAPITVHDRDGRTVLLTGRRAR